MLRDVRQHLDLARKCAQSGRIDGALAHAAVVDPDHRLRVRVDCSTIPATDQGLYRNALNGAFRMWEDVLGEKEFEVTECGPYDIMVHFQPNVSDKGIEVCGHSTWTRGVLNPDTHPVPVFSADVWVRMRKPNGEPLTFEQLRACAAHEFGHILGLDDSLDGGLMGKMDFNHPVIAIRPEEVEPLLRARQEAALIRRTFVVHGSK
ncbi:MAG TPA: matrixin family metalloprotease [Fimbriimonadaceae bacterium]|nr:matrixin family metalloprotease [Fimbriimonadaceae bacterium]